MKNLFALLVVMLLAIAANAGEMPAAHAGRLAGPANSAPARSDASGGASSIAGLRDAWVSAFNAKQSDKIATFYTDDAVLIDYSGATNGKAAIGDTFKKAIDSGATGLTVNSSHSEESANLGYDTGSFTENIPQGGATQQIEGHYIVALKKVGGKWLIVAHCSSAQPKQ